MFLILSILDTTKEKAQTVTLSPWKGFIWIFTFFKWARKNTFTACRSGGHWASSPGHPWHCYTHPIGRLDIQSAFPDVYLLQHCDFFSSNGNAYVINAEDPWSSRGFHDRLEARYGSIKSKSTKPRNTVEGDMCKDTQFFPSLARCCYTFTFLCVPTCIRLPAQL